MVEPQPPRFPVFVGVGVGWGSGFSVLILPKRAGIALLLSGSDLLQVRIENQFIKRLHIIVDA